MFHDSTLQFDHLMRKLNSFSTFLNFQRKNKSTKFSSIMAELKTFTSLKIWRIKSCILPAVEYASQFDIC